MVVSLEKEGNGCGIAPQQHFSASEFRSRLGYDAKTSRRQCD
jgi:hypothetical protein